MILEATNNLIFSKDFFALRLNEIGVIHNVRTLGGGRDIPAKNVLACMGVGRRGEGEVQL